MILMVPSAQAATVPGDSAEGERLHDASALQLTSIVVARALAGEPHLLSPVDGPHSGL
jgi:hypothetical protein